MSDCRNDLVFVDAQSCGHHKQRALLDWVEPPDRELLDSTCRTYPDEKNV